MVLAIFPFSKRRSIRCPYPLASRWCLYADDDQLLDLKRQVHASLYKLLQCRRAKTWTEPPETGDHPVKRIVANERIRGIHRICWMSSFGRWPAYIVGSTSKTLSSHRWHVQILEWELTFHMLLYASHEPSNLFFFRSLISSFLTNVAPVIPANVTCPVIGFPCPSVLSNTEKPWMDRDIRDF